MIDKKTVEFLRFVASKEPNCCRKCETISEGFSDQEILKCYNLGFIENVSGPITSLSTDFEFKFRFTIKGQEALRKSDDFKEKEVLKEKDYYRWYKDPVNISIVVAIVSILVTFFLANK